MASKLDRFMASPEAQQIFGNPSRVTVWRWERDEIIPESHKIARNKKVWLESEVRIWMLMQRLRTWILKHGRQAQVPEAVLTWVEERRFQVQLPEPVLVWLEARKTELPKDFLELLQAGEEK